MPLDHTNGEQIDGMPHIYRVVPAAKYANENRLTTIVKEMTGKSFRREIEVEKPIFEAAMNHAMEGFVKAGLQLGSDIDCLCQEYFTDDIIMFLFCAKINGEDHYVTAPFKLHEQQIAELTQRGMWKPLRLN